MTQSLNAQSLNAQSLHAQSLHATNRESVAADSGLIFRQKRQPSNGGTGAWTVRVVDGDRTVRQQIRQSRQCLQP